MISVIVAIYNMEQYLERCIDSILAQDYHSFELILINDGSTDKSGEICDFYSQNDNRIKVLHQENVGIGRTRELGVKIAIGDYILFVDPDDWIAPNMLSSMLNFAQQKDSDIVICNFYYTGADYEYVSRQYFTNSDNSFLIKKVVSGDLHGSYCNKLIKAKCLQDDSVIYPHLSFCEDQYVFLQLLLKNYSISFLDLPLYYYYQRDQSETNKVDHSFINNKLQPYLTILYELLKYDLNLIKTSNFFYYSWLKDFDINEQVFIALKPQNYCEVYNCYLSPSRKIKLSNQMNYTIFSKIPFYMQLLTNKLWKKLTFQK